MDPLRESRKIHKARGPEEDTDGGGHQLPGLGPHPLDGRRDGELKLKLHCLNSGQLVVSHSV